MREWVALFSGAASAGVAVYLQFTKKPELPTRSFWGLAIACLLYAFFAAWRAEHVEVLAERTKNKPDLRGLILQIHNHPSPNGSGSRVLTVVQIKNLGAESIVDGYTATVRTGDGGLVKGTLLALPDTIDLDGPQGMITFSGKEALYAKSSSPIPRGGMMTGLLWAAFPTLQKDTYDALTIEVAFNDVLGKKYVATFTPGPPDDVLKDQFAVCPGMAPPIFQPKAK